MKRTLLSLSAFGAVVAAVAVVVPTYPSLTGGHAVTQAKTETTLIFDIASDCRTFNYARGIPLPQIVRGDSFIMNGRIFTAGTLAPETDPNASGSIGDFVMRGTSTATLAEHLANPSAYGVFVTQYLLLNDGQALVAEGWFTPSGVGRAALTGGMGAFSGAAGELSAIAIGANSTQCPNYRFTITLKKQAPK